MKFSACIDALYSPDRFFDGMKEVKEAGLSAYEFWGWWDKDVDRIAAYGKELGLTLSTFCTKFISLVDSSQHPAYREGLKESIEIAQKLNCKTLITQVGNELVGIAREEQKKALIEGLSSCIPLLEDSGITLVFEPLNILVDHKGYFLSRSDEALQIAEAVNHPQVKILFDFYHQQITEGNLISNSTAMIGQIGHTHFAGNPGRQELDIGEVYYPAVFDALRTAGYQGYLGLEYHPTKDVLTALKQFAALERKWEK